MLLEIEGKLNWIFAKVFQRLFFPKSVIVSKVGLELLGILIKQDPYIHWLLTLNETKVFYNHISTRRIRVKLIVTVNPARLFSSVIATRVLLHIGKLQRLW